MSGVKEWIHHVRQGGGPALPHQWWQMWPWHSHIYPLQEPGAGQTRAAWLSLRIGLWDRSGLSTTRSPGAGKQ